MGTLFLKRLLMTVVLVMPLVWQGSVCLGQEWGSGSYRTLMITDTVNRVRYEIGKNNVVEIRLKDMHVFGTYHLMGITDEGFIYRTWENRYEKLQFSSIDAITLREKGAYLKTFLVVAGVSALLSAVIASRSANTDVARLVIVAVSPFTVVILPLILAGAIYSGAYPVDHIGLDDRKYKWRFVR